MAASAIIYDESIFTDGRWFRDHNATQINVSDSVDRWLVGRLKDFFPVTGVCDVMSLNSPLICNSTNVVSMQNLAGSSDLIKDILPYDLIAVVDHQTLKSNNLVSVPLQIAEIPPNMSSIVWSLPEKRKMSDLECAKMLKFFSINSDSVKISTELYKLVSPVLGNFKAWFRPENDKNFSIQVFKEICFPIDLSTDPVEMN